MKMKIWKNIGIITIATSLFCAPFIAIAVFKGSLILREVSYQELKKNEEEFLAIAPCFDSLEAVERAITDDLIWALFKEGNDCLKSLSPSKQKNINYLNLISLENKLKQGNNKQINADMKQIIITNTQELGKSLVSETRLYFLINLVVQTLLWSFCFWLVVGSLFLVIRNSQIF